MGGSLEGRFASPGFRRVEHWFHRAGVLGLILFAAAAALGLVGRAETVGRAALVYAFLLVVFRVAGRRTLAQITNFDLILVLIIGDVTQQSIIGDDYTIVTGLVAVATLIGLDVALGKAKAASPSFDAVADGLPVVLVAHGAVNADALQKEGVATDDVLAAARETHGLTALAQIDFAILEQSGTISIVPRQGSTAEQAAR
jgi:uncharacterized membrane protein YcaP (DUF421 family)